VSGLTDRTPDQTPGLCRRIDSLAILTTSTPVVLADILSFGLQWSPNMFTEFEKSQREFLAFQESIANSSVGILTDGGQGVGTGTLVRYTDKRLILTARHVVQGNHPSNLRIAFRPAGSLQEAPLRQFGSKPTALLPGEPVNVLSVVEDAVSDLAALVLNPSQQVRAPAEFYDATGLKDFHLADETSIIFQGFPVDNAVAVGPTTKAVGIAAEHTRYDSSLLTTLSSCYDASHQFLFKYGWEGDLLPYGFSGAAAWGGKQPSAFVWTANPVLVGVITHYIKKHEVIIAANLKSVLNLFSRL
jgi:hypothetical protein